jgi:DnaJ-class molecular chaperone
MELNPQVKCPECDGSGEVPTNWIGEDTDRVGCYLCGGEGTLSKIKLELHLQREADMKDMSDMQDFEDRISQPIDGGE